MSKKGPEKLRAEKRLAKLFGELKVENFYFRGAQPGIRVYFHGTNEADALLIELVKITGQTAALKLPQRAVLGERLSPAATSPGEKRKFGGSRLWFCERLCESILTKVATGGRKKKIPVEIMYEGVRA